MRGGEKVLEEFCILFPGAPIYTLVCCREKLSERLREHPITESSLGWFTGARHLYKHALPIFPWLIRALKVKGKPQFVLSSDASLIKGLRIPEGVPHVCYCHSPPRYLWDQQGSYEKSAGVGLFKRAVLRWITPSLQRWDRAAAQRVDYFIANSEFVRQRILHAYGKDARVIHPPVAVDDFQPVAEVRDFYLIVSQLVPYKRVDIAVEAFNKSGKRLVVIGEGSELANLKAMARSNVELLGSQPFPVLREHYARCRGFVFPGVEDFGITPLEAQASGRPVIALRAGGALETIIEGETGLFFDEQNADSLMDAVERFEQTDWQSKLCRQNALRFGPARFRREISEFLTSHGLPGGETVT